MVNQIYKEIKALPPEAFDKAISVELESLSDEEIQRRKEQLEAQIKIIKNKDSLDNSERIKLKQLKKQSGLVKSVIKRQNLTADLEINNSELNQYRRFFFSGVEGNAFEFVNFKINQLSDQNRLIQLQLKPTKTLTPMEKQRRDALMQSQVNIHQLSPDKMTDDQYKLLKENRLKEVELRQKLKIKDFKINFGLPGDIKLNVEVINKLQDEIKILDLKKSVRENNIALGSDVQLDVNRMKELRKENSKYYGEIAELEGRENTYIDFEKENLRRAKEKESNRLKQSFGLNKKFNLRGEEELIGALVTH
ncbi:hypothetical protein G7084_04455 [Weissella coleopterorum]|uniref:Uncharacterized protein n=1 Tax=Weissella coleopterorum TaxID=2714949 RepID=A0A6G8B060_9LACO|nr:hypothetical protein [Weissella coleopterorum]QIL50627.1 hypothetical protein G7084_04455 [Weissella coleopterorum]